MTEVSLALLGNQFFDIHGQRHHTLEEVCRPDIKKRDSYNADNSDLMVYLSETQNNKVAKSSSEGVGSSKKSRPRTKPKPNESEDHEVKKHATKLVPQVGRIGNQRRNTVAGMRPNSNQLERQTKVFDKLVEQGNYDCVWNLFWDNYSYTHVSYRTAREASRCRTAKGRVLLPTLFEHKRGQDGRTHHARVPCRRGKAAASRQ